MFPFKFGVTEFTPIFLLLTIPPYIASLIFALKYVHARKTEFFSFFMLTFVLNVLIFFTKDMITLLVVYEMVSLFSFPLILQERIKESFKAAKLYFFFSLLSGVLIFGGLIFLTNPDFKLTAAALMGLGFLIKAGGYPFHVWLPEAHPVAPSPASAILSGCIIKIGFFGMVQTFLLIEAPPIFGGVLLVIALITMFYGVLQALTQSNCKRMLAYHSVSQMGYILMGLALFIMFKNYDALAAGILHAVNHAWFKSALFISAGVLVIYFSTLDMYSIRGFLKKKWLVAVLFLIAVMGISGVPFTNGFVSKNALHESLMLHFSILFIVAEAIFLITAVGTFASNFKMFYLTSFRSMRKKYKMRFDWREVVPLSLLAILVLSFGIVPILYKSFLPEMFGSFSHVLENLTIGNHGFVHSAMAFIWIVFFGIVLIAIGLKKGWFHLQIPYSLTPLSWWFSLYNAGMNFMKGRCNDFDKKITIFYDKLTAFFVSSWFLKNQKISTCVYAEKMNNNLPSACCRVEKILNITGNAIIPGENTISSMISKSSNTVDIQVFSFWNWVKDLFINIFAATDKADEKNAKIYDFVATNIGKNVITVTTIFTAIGFILFLFLF